MPGMSETRFNIVFDGALLPGVDATTAKLNLANLFRSDISAIERLFGGHKVALKSNLSQTEAQKYLEALNQSGIDARIEAEPALQLNLDEVQQSSPPMTARHSESLIEPASPYAPPRAHVGDAVAEYATLKPFSFDGRIGRLRYLAWTMALTLVMMVVVGVAFALGAAWIFTSGSIAAMIVGGLLAAVVFLGFAYVSIQFNVQRLHDLGWSGWLWLLNLIPFVGSVFPFVLIFAPGNEGANRYGPPPPRNNTGVKVLASLWLVMIVLIIFATVAGVFSAIEQDYDTSSLSSYESSESTDADVAEPAEEPAEAEAPSVDSEEQ
jgi:uncharacterized membrane protein YhaH (DUF805 family)